MPIVVAAQEIMEGRLKKIARLQSDQIPSAPPHSKSYIRAFFIIGLNFFQPLYLSSFHIKLEFLSSFLSHMQIFRADPLLYGRRLFSPKIWFTMFNKASQDFKYL